MSTANGHRTEPGPATLAGPGWSPEEQDSARDMPHEGTGPAGGGVTGDGPGRRIRLTPASAVRMLPTRWTWLDRIPAGALTVLPGREGIGKSLLLAWLAAQITRGTLPGEHEGSPRPVIYAASEDSWAHTIAPRLYAAGADLDQVFRVEVEHDEGIGQLVLPRDCDGLAVEVERLDAALLAADPLLSLIHAGIDTHRDRDLRTALEPLARLADRTRCAVVGLAHFNKSASADALNLITGSRAFSAVARSVLAVARDDDAEDGSCVLSQAKNNLGRLDLPSLRYVVQPAEVPTSDGPAHVGRLVFVGETDRTVNDILGEASNNEDTRGERDSAASWLTDYLASRNGEAPYAEILKAARAEGIAPRTLQRARARAQIAVSRTGFPAHTTWQLPAEQTGPASVAPQSCQSRQLSEPGATGATGATAPTETHTQSQTPSERPGGTGT